MKDLENIREIIQQIINQIMEAYNLGEEFKKSGLLMKLYNKLNYNKNNNDRFILITLRKNKKKNLKGSE